MAGNIGITARDLCTEALSIIGVAAQGEQLSADDLASAMFTLGALVDGWGAERLTIYNVAALAFVTMAGKGTYSLGPAGSGADWLTPGPLPSALVELSYLSGSVESPIKQHTQREWALNPLKTLAGGGGVISDAYIALGFPTHSISLYPLPGQAIPVNVYAANAIPAFTDPSNGLALPPGYQEALTYELALKCAAKFGAAVPQFLPQAWDEAKTKIKARNFQANISRVDPALQPRAGVGRFGGGYNIFSDQ